MRGIDISPTPRGVRGAGTQAAVRVDPDAKTGGVVEIILKLRQDIALSLQDPVPPPPAVDELVQMVDGLGGTLSPMHPGGVDPLLVSFYRVEVDEGGVEHALETLLASDAVDAAYVKPADELP